MVTYQRLWETLKNRNIRKHDLMELADISSTTLTKLNKNEIVALTVLVKICKVLDCQMENVVEVIKEDMYHANKKDISIINENN